MITRSRSLTRLLCAGLFLFIPGLVLAGANAGGTLILHANPSLVYTNETQNYCGQAALDSCSAAVTSVAWDPDHTVVFHVVAAFPPESQPRMKGVSFGIDYDPAKFELDAHGTCADMEVPDGGWPQPGTGTGQTWIYTTQTASLTDVYWFAGHTYSEVNPDSASFSLIPRPLDGGIFVDDAAPRTADSVAEFGRLGFGTSGYLPCPREELPRGACCRPNGVCDIRRSGDCQQRNWSFGGQGSPCLPNPCPYPLPSTPPVHAERPVALTELFSPETFGQLRGEIRSAEDGTLLADARVALYEPASVHGHGLPICDDSTEVGWDIQEVDALGGQFVLNHVLWAMLERCRVMACAPGFRPASVEASGVARSGGDPLVFRLLPRAN